MADELDQRWNWVEVTRFGDPTPRWIKASCRHTDFVTVEVDGEILAHLCRTCDAQLPEEWPL